MWMLMSYIVHLRQLSTLQNRIESSRYFIAVITSHSFHRKIHSLCVNLLFDSVNNYTVYVIYPVRFMGEMGDFLWLIERSL